ncbi:MAG: alanyl-tRNA editing protein [Anaeromyxobacter sp.]
MTVRLDLDDPSLLRFEAQVLAVRELAGRLAVVLDRTAFYPEGGGQPADRGQLGGVPVVDVQEVGGEVLHALEGAAPTGHVAGEVDGARRLDHLQQHHGQHLLSAAFERVAGARTLSFHLGAELCTIDLDRAPGALGPEVLRAVEAEANRLVFADLPVTVRTFAPEELARLPLRKAPEKGARVVVVREGDADDATVIDASPCGGTHPRRTGAVGAIAVLRAVKWGSGSRVEFACGGRVVRMLSVAGSRLAEAAAALRCAPAEVPEAAARTGAELSARRKDVERLLGALAEGEADRLGALAPAVVRATLSPPAPGAATWLKAVSLALAGRGRIALLGAVEEGRAYLAFARPRGEGPHLGERLKVAAAALGGKGGGAPDAAQGSGPEVAALERVLEEAAKGV